MAAQQLFVDQLRERRHKDENAARDENAEAARDDASTKSAEHRREAERAVRRRLSELQHELAAKTREVQELEALKVAEVERERSDDLHR